jgi:hypothetical protein
MRVAYVSTDEVNLDLAERIAAKCGAEVHRHLPKDPSPTGFFDGVLYNLDDMASQEREAFLEGFRRGKPDRPTAVHGYDITEDQASALFRNGVAAARHLHANLLRFLVTAAQHNPETLTPDDIATELTWVNLVS